MYPSYTRRPCAPCWTRDESSAGISIASHEAPPPRIWPANISSYETPHAASNPSPPTPRFPLWTGLSILGKRRPRSFGRRRSFYSREGGSGGRLSAARCVGSAARTHRFRVCGRRGSLPRAGGKSGGCRYSKRRGVRGGVLEAFERGGSAHPRRAGVSVVA